MRRLSRTLALAVVLIAQGAAIPARAEEFRIRSADGVTIHGDASTGSSRPRIAVILVPGTGVFDRDAEFGDSGTSRDLIFKDLAERMAARGLATIRFDARGMPHGAKTAADLDRKLLAGRTTDNMRDDLAAIYEWTRSPTGLSARCVVFFAHSEGALHVARLAGTGAPSPALVIGMGAGMDSPAETLRWQVTERDAHSLGLMDADRDGITTNEEVRANLARTPSAVHGVLEPYLNASGAWTASDVAALRAAQATVHASLRSEALTNADADPYPSADKATSSHQWWKSWFLDERPTAELLARWPTAVILHYGDKDSQTNAARQTAAASAFLPAQQVRIRVHADRGHTLGDHVVLGPIDETIADSISGEAASVACE